MVSLWCFRTLTVPEIYAKWCMPWVAVAVTCACVMMTDAQSPPRQQYAMYVWSDAFDPSIPGCGEQQFLDWNTHGKCFTGSWDTPAKRQWLWNTCSLPGREISAIFLSGFHHVLRDAYNSGQCDSAAVVYIRESLAEGHSQVSSLKIYALFAVSDIAVSEKDLVKYVVFYNDVCARSVAERLDGVATNNEAYAPIKCGSIAERTAYLDGLKQITVEASKQRSGTLLTHYSVSWHWGLCDEHTKSMMTWNGKTDDAVHHMIDIFDSIDVQVGYITFPQIADRMRIAGIDYSHALGKTIYTTFYTNKNSPCQTSFFPQRCHIHGHSEREMFSIFDMFSSNGIEYARPCIHYFRGVYSSGGHPDWPMHNQDPATLVG